MGLLFKIISLNICIDSSDRWASNPVTFCVKMCIFGIRNIKLSLFIPCDRSILHLTDFVRPSIKNGKEHFYYRKFFKGIWVKFFVKITKYSDQWTSILKPTLSFHLSIIQHKTIWKSDIWKFCDTLGFSNSCYLRIW